MNLVDTNLLSSFSSRWSKPWIPQDTGKTQRALSKEQVSLAQKNIKIITASIAKKMNSCRIQINNPKTSGIEYSNLYRKALYNGNLSHEYKGKIYTSSDNRLFEYSKKKLLNAFKTKKLKHNFNNLSNEEITYLQNLNDVFEKKYSKKHSVLSNMYSTYNEKMTSVFLSTTMKYLKTIQVKL